MRVAQVIWHPAWCGGWLAVSIAVVGLSVFGLCPWWFGALAVIAALIWVSHLRYALRMRRD